MKCFYLLLLIFGFATVLNSQVVYTNYTPAFRHDLDSCTFTNIPVDEYPNGNFNNKPFTITPTGQVLWLNKLGTTTTIFYSDLDSASTTAVPYGPFPQISQLYTIWGIALDQDNNLYMAAPGFELLFRLNLDTGSLTQLSEFTGRFTGGLTYAGEILYAVSSLSINNTPQQVVLKVDPTNGLITDTLSLNSFPDPNTSFFPGLTHSWQTDCSGKQLISSALYSPPLGGQVNHSFRTFSLTEPFPLNLDTFCSGPATTAQLAFNTLSNTGSWETHRENCELRLDLDADDSAGRVGPHFKNATTCTNIFALTDTDVSIRTPAGNSIDSVRIAYRDGSIIDEFQVFQFVPNGSFIVINEGNSSLLILPNTTPLTNSQWASFLSSLNIQVPELRTSGLRVIESKLYSDGQRADIAQSFIDIQQNKKFAGYDTTYWACRSLPSNLLEALPNVNPNGRWEPELVYGPNSISAAFNSDSMEFGEYRYILEQPGCEADTAVVNVITHPFLVEAVPRQDDTIFLCENSSYVWDVPNIPYRRKTYDADTYDLINQPITYSDTGHHRVLIFYDFLLPTTCFENISLTLLPAPESELTRIVDTVLCGEQSLTLGGITFDQEGSYFFSGPGQGCDTTYTLELTYDNGPSIVVDTVTCAAAYTFNDTTYTSSGTYQFTAPGAFCDTAYTLNLTLEEPPTRTIDTTICGGSLNVGDNTFTASGSYQFSTPGPLCDTAYTLQLTILPPPATVVLDTAVCAGESIVFGGNTYNQFGTYELQIGPEGCASTYQLTVSERAPVQVELDTTLCAGEILLYAGTFFSSAGVYNVNNTIGQGCDSIFAITLSYLPAVLTVLDTAILEGESLLVADTVLTSAGTYEFTYPLPDGCDSLFRVVLDIISSTAGPAGRAAAAYRVTNPIRSLRDFRVFDAAGTEVAVRELEIFGIGGRRVGAWPGLTDLPDLPLAAGVYVYRFADSRGQRVIGRVVVLGR